MRKLLSFMLLALLLLNSNVTVFAAGKAETSDSIDNEEYIKDLYEAKSVLNILVEDEIFQNDTVTRADFIVGLFKFLKYESGNVENDFFSDVKMFDEFAPEVYAAADLGWIAKSDSFEPLRAIKPTEALRILNRVIGFGTMADVNGAYPYGDLYVGKKKGITKGLDMSAEAVTKDTAYLLLFRAAAESTYRQIQFGKTSQFSDDGDSLLKEYYGVDIYNGIISRTPYNTLSGTEYDKKSGVAEIDGVQYKCEHIDWDMLGTKGRVYVQKNSNVGEAVIYARDLSKRFSVPLIDIEKKEGDRVYYNSNGNSKSVRLNTTGVSVIFNGRKVTSGIDSLFASTVGEVVFADNDNDNVYDVVFVNKYDYMCILAYDSVSETVRDAYSNSATFKLGDGATIIEDENGNLLNPLDIEEDDAFRVLKSQDNNFKYLKKCGTKITGVLKSIDEGTNTITVGEFEYYMSDYFRNFSYYQYAFGAEGVFVVDNDVVVMCTIKGTEMVYGYLLKCYEAQREACIKLRIFTQSGKIESFNVKNKVKFDGERHDDAYVYSQLTDGAGETLTQLIKFSISQSGEINKIDTATNVLPTTAGIYPEKENSLTHYTNLSGTAQYSANSLGMGEKYNCSNSIIFCIPTDLSDTDAFKIEGRGVFSHDHSYNVDVYDIDESGCAKVLIYRGATDSVNPDKPSMLVSKVVTKLDEDDEIVYGVEGWCDGVFTSLTLPLDFVVKKLNSGGTVVRSSHGILSSGDIISYSVDKNDRITAMDIIYDARKGIMSNNNSIFNSDTKSSPMYYEGMVYDVKAGYAVISITKTLAGYDFSQDSLRFVRLGTIKLGCYNADTCELREINANDIKTYKTDGRNAYYGVFCLSNHSLKSAFFYEDMEERK